MIEFKSLNNLPDTALSKSHYYCDYIELIVLCDSDDGVAVNDIYDRFLEGERISDIGSEDGAISNEKWNSRIQCWFDQLVTRGESYGDDYPFEFIDGRISLKNDMNDRQKLYLGLLLCSLLSYIENSATFTSVFEKISCEATKSYLPAGAEVHVFGKSSATDTKYQGTLMNKVRELATDLSVKVTCSDDDFRKYDNGDGGVDVVAWVPFSNDTNLERKQIFLGQSASGKNWNTKQGSVDRMFNYLNLPRNVQNLLFVPFDFRDENRNFSEKGEITSELIFDRHRLMNLIDPDVIFNDDLGVLFQSKINASIDFEEDIV